MSRQAAKCSTTASSPWLTYEKSDHSYSSSDQRLGSERVCSSRSSSSGVERWAKKAVLVVFGVKAGRSVSLERNSRQRDIYGLIGKKA